MSMDEVFRALADPVRRQLLDRLHARNGQTLSELCDIPVPQLPKGISR